MLIFGKEYDDKQVYAALIGAGVGYFLGPNFVVLPYRPWSHALIGGGIGWFVQPMLQPSA